MLFSFVFVVVKLVAGNNLLSDLDLPFQHYPFYFYNNPSAATELCKNVSNSSDMLDGTSFVSNVCKHVRSNLKKCWGYESDCSMEDVYMLPDCNGSSNGWTHNKVEQRKVFYSQADFGYIKDLKKELRTYCLPNNQDQEPSYLKCTQNLRFCQGSNIMIDFKRLLIIEEPMRYRDDVLDEKSICGWNCNLQKDALLSQGAHKSVLQSWWLELRNFKQCSSKPKCDIVVSKPTYIMKLDATINMYHHFCDFLNLYLTFHLNNSFSTDNNILIWDTFPYRSNLGATWKAFTRNQILDLSTFRGKKVCFKSVVFSLLPRMIFGMYYNMPLIPGCEKSGVFHAFNRHILHKLRIEQTFTYQNFSSPDGNKYIRITLISRQTKFRRILNEDELVKRLEKKSKFFLVRKINFSHQMPFEAQLKVSQNSDILIGIHGAGLTHCLFQPDWGSLFELFNCDDVNCYKDLARLRGVHYITWEKRDKLHASHVQNDTLAHMKFSNYRFDPEEFLSLIMKAVKSVRKRRKKYFEDIMQMDLLNQKFSTLKSGTIPHDEF